MFSARQELSGYVIHDPQDAITSVDEMALVIVVPFDTVMASRAKARKGCAANRAGTFKTSYIKGRAELVT